MRKGKRIGIYFTSGSNWLGGVYYLVNLVNSFNYLPEADQEGIEFVVFYNDISERFIKLFAFPRVELIKIKSLDAKTTFLRSLLMRKNFFLTEEILEADIDGLYPFNDFPVGTNTDLKLISWYPDLQHRFYPEYFEKMKLWQREFRLKKLLKHGQHLALSSIDVSSHFDRWYPNSDIDRTILPFVSLTEDTQWVARAEVTEKYDIGKPYFMVSNQFYKHKDHKTLLEAIVEVKRKNKEVLVVMTGIMDDYRDPTYIDQLKQVISDHSIDDHIKMLGVIPRNEQLSLMKYATAVIQPSLFEGWSTVVEDVKSIGGSIIASDIAIHKEQLGAQGVLFQNKNRGDLADKMIEVMQNPKIARTSFDYKKHILTFAESFKNLL